MPQALLVFSVLNQNNVVVDCTDTTTRNPLGELMSVLFAFSVSKSVFRGVRFRFPSEHWRRNRPYRVVDRRRQLRTRRHAQGGRQRGV